MKISRCFRFAAACLLGGTAQASPPQIEVWHGPGSIFGVPGAPQRYINILGKVSDPDGVASLTYTVNGGQDSAVSVGPDGRRLARQGDFNIDVLSADLTTGANQVVITATDGQGQVARDTVTVDYQPGTTWPLTYDAEWGAGVEAAARVVDGRWHVEGGQLRTTVTGYDRLVAIGDTSWTDYEVTVPVTIHAVDGASGALVGVLTRWLGHTDDPVSGWQPKSGWNPFGAICGWRWTSATTVRLEAYGTGTGVAMTPATGQRYLLKIQVETAANGAARYRIRAWKDSDPEPPTWQVVAVRTSLDRGALLLLAHYADVSFGEVSVRPLPSPDDTPPSAPTELTAQEDGPHRIDLSWTAASDPESGVAHYIVYRDGDAVATTTATALTDSGLLPWTTYTYEVSAVNGYGLEGERSGPVAETTPLLGLFKPTAATPPPASLAHHPNPFNAETNIRFALSEPTPVRLAVYDATGRLLRVLVEEVRGPGAHMVVWDGRDAEGRTAATGVYLCRLQSGSATVTRKMLMLR